MVGPEVVPWVVVADLVSYLIPALAAILTPLLTVSDPVGTVFYEGTITNSGALADAGTFTNSRAFTNTRTLTNARTLGDSRTFGDSRTLADGRSLTNAGTRAVAPGRQR
jgi:hypothetical protein